ncbi:hypothetical protein QYE76_021740 [Lolium multiflorum]|uniref:SKP1-like protein n=1 Tax=Lolium multiflorum TaxID=4521 RepID=A0AAD8R733_LOLMU|nr:hypothetical protein QYE76_021740 [Lolium multiflorum]
MATSSSSAAKTVTLRSSDGEEFVVKADTFAAASVLVRNILEDDCAGGAIPLQQARPGGQARGRWPPSSTSSSPPTTSKVQRLLDLACKTVADQMRGKTVEEMRAHFMIANDYTPEDEAEVRSETPWAFE